MNDKIPQQTMQIGTKTVSLFRAEKAGAPLVVLNTVRGEGGDVWRTCQAIGCPPFSLVAVENLDWNADMSPWAIPPISKDDTPCTGGADSYLALLLEEILPQATAALTADTGATPGATPAYTAIAGYSLAGLFALYAAHQTGAFSRIASASGSLWFPRFTEYAQSHDFCRPPDCIYLSLGDTEAKTRNRILSPVQENTGRLCDIWQSRGIPVTFELNKGNHFADPTGRMARGIKWMLEQK